MESVPMASLVEASISSYRQGTEKGIDLESLVSNASWRELLIELVETNKLDPWDIDLSRVVDSYMAIVKEMRVMDLHVPSNIMLAASILLRMKSENMGIFAEPAIEEVPEMALGRVTPEVPELLPRARMQPGRKISLNELMEALDEAIKTSTKRETIAQERFMPIMDRLIISEDDIDEKIDAAFGLVKRSADREGVTTFARISSGFGSMESMLLDLFVPLLFLAHMNKVMLMQEEFFNEIFIKLESDGNGR